MMTDNEIIQEAERRLDVYEDIGYSHARELTNLAKRLKSADEKNERIIEISDKTIKVQSAEIDRLKEENLKLFQKLHQIRAEAIKEFAKKLKAYITDMITNIRNGHAIHILKKIDELVKEMVGDE